MCSGSSSKFEESKKVSAWMSYLTLGLTALLLSIGSVAEQISTFFIICINTNMELSEESGYVDVHSLNFLNYNLHTLH